MFLFWHIYLFMSFSKDDGLIERNELNNEISGYT